jgi:hypothetical protein
MRALLLAMALAAIGCGDDGVPPANDLSTSSADLATKIGATCGVDGVRLSCGGSCAVCSYAGGAGKCVTPCKTTQSSCPSGQSCHAARGDGGTSTTVQFDGDCNAFDGYCN